MKTSLLTPVRQATVNCSSASRQVLEKADWLMRLTDLAAVDLAGLLPTQPDYPRPDKRGTTVYLAMYETWNTEIVAAFKKKKIVQTV